MYEILEKLETGIVLSGAEVKSIRAHQVNLKGSFVEISNRNEVWTRNIHISPYKQAPQADYSPTQKRKLLLHKIQIEKLKKGLEIKGTSIIPLDFHLSHNRIKLTIGVCQSKKKHDRRNELKKRSQDLEVRRTLKKYG